MEDNKIETELNKLFIKYAKQRPLPEGLYADLFDLIKRTSFSNQVEKPVILELAGKLKTSEIENELQKYLEDKQVYDNYKRSFMLPDDAEIVSRYVGIFIRTILVDIKSKLSK